MFSGPKHNAAKLYLNKCGLPKCVMRLFATVLLCLGLEMWPESPQSPSRVCSRNGCQVVFHLSWGESFEASLVADAHLNVFLCHLTLKALLKHKEHRECKRLVKKRETW